MTYGISPTGFTKPTIEEIIAETVDDIHATVDPTFDLSPEQPDGQFVGISAQREAIVWEALETLAHSIDPNAAEDSLLDATCSLTGTTRESAKKSQVTLNCNVNIDFVAAQGAMMANVQGQGAIRFVNVAAVNLTGSPAGVYPIVFEAVDYGPVVANAGTLTVITAPVSGWNSCTNPLDAELGALRETDTSLRVRREDEVTAPGGSNVDALRADVLKVAGVEQCFVYENVLLTTDADGLPGKSIEVVVYDGETPNASDQAIAETIFASKPPGAETVGSVLVLVQDATGVVHPVRFNRATIKQVWLVFTLTIVTNDFPKDGIQQVKDAVALKATKLQKMGVDVVALRMKSAAESIPGVIDVPTLKLGFAPNPIDQSNLPITGREIADIDTSRITVTTALGTL